jgi:hypothetical protein
VEDKPVAEFKIGDKVRLLCEPHNYCGMSANGFPVGGVFDVFVVHNNIDPKQITILNPGNYKCMVLPHQIERVGEEKTEGDRINSKGVKIEVGKKYLVDYPGNHEHGDIKPMTLLKYLATKDKIIKGFSYKSDRVSRSCFELTSSFCDALKPCEEKPKTITSHTPIVWDDCLEVPVHARAFDMWKAWREGDARAFAGVDFGGLKTDTQYKSLAVKHLY